MSKRAREESCILVQEVVFIILMTKEKRDTPKQRKIKHKPKVEIERHRLKEEICTLVLEVESITWIATTKRGTSKAESPSPNQSPLSLINHTMPQVRVIVVAVVVVVQDRFSPAQEEEPIISIAKEIKGTKENVKMLDKIKCL